MKYRCSNLKLSQFQDCFGIVSNGFEMLLIFLSDFEFMNFNVGMDINQLFNWLLRVGADRIN